MTIQDIVSTVASHNWLALVVLLMLYARKLFSSGSKFPITLSPNWQPVFLALAGAVAAAVTSEEQGASWGASVLSAFVGFVGAGAVDGLLVALFGSASSAPTWARAIVFLVDDVAGGGAASKRGFARARLLATIAVSGVVLLAALSGGRRAAPSPAAGCAWFGANSGTVVQQGASDVACELAQVEAAGSVDEQTLLACAGGVLSNLFNDITSALGYYESGGAQPGSAAAPTQLVCASPTVSPPYPGAPICVTAATLSLLQGEHDHLAQALADGGH